jgi:hypothetical protein
LPLPVPGFDGVVVLSQPGPYSARTLAVVGPLTIRAAEGVRPVIEIDSEPLRLSGTTVILEGVALRRAAGSHASGPLLRAISQNLGFVRCVIESGPGAAGDVASRSTPLVEWTMPDARDATGGQIGLANTILSGGGAAIHCTMPPRSVHARELLRLGGGALLELGSPVSGRPVQMTLRSSTLRESGGLVALPAPTANVFGAVRATLERCVLDPREDAGLVEFHGDLLPEAAASIGGAVSITGEESLLQMGGRILVRRDSQGRLHAIAEAEARVEGLRFAELSWRGPASSEPPDSVIEHDVMTTGTLSPPGITAEAFAGVKAAPYNPPAGEASVH